KNKKIIKKYIKDAKKCLESVENQFDEIYLLYYSFDYEGRKVFSSYENSILSFLAESLFDNLNEMEENELADRIFMLKGKLDLGFQRYFWQKQEQILLEKFIPEIYFYKIADDKIILKVLSKFIFDKGFCLKELERIRKKNSKEKNMETLLLTFILMKKVEDNNWNKEFSKIEIFLQYFPLIIERKLNIEQSIEKSIFFGFNEVSKKFEKEKVSLFELESLKIANLVLKLVLK
ncbi:MAG: hypothetical protein KC589_04575, partial [Nanoarchaeota archaeon]|nr:hypothetical protein [Nanoarchaeota archaeon]